MTGTHLEQRVPCDDGKEPLEALTAGLDDLVREAVCEDLSRERWDVHARRLALEDVPEGLKVRVAAAHDRVAELERGDVRLSFRRGTTDGVDNANEHV